MPLYNYPAYPGKKRFDSLIHAVQIILKNSVVGVSASEEPVLQLGLIISEYPILYPWIFFFMTPISNHLSHCSYSADETIKSCIPTFWLGKYYAVTEADNSWLQIVETPSQVGFIIKKKKKSNSPSSWKVQT